MFRARYAAPGTRESAFLVLLFVAVALGAAAAQGVSCNSGCTTPVTFTPDGATYSAAIGDALAPDGGNPAVELRYDRGGQDLRSVTIERSAWAPSNGIRLEARIESRAQGRPSTTDWFEVGETPVEFVDQRRVRSSVSYRWVVDGAEAGGTYRTTVTFSRDNGGSRETLSHEIVVTVPSYLAIRIDGASAGTDGTLEFDYGLRPNLYLNGVITGEPLPITGADFTAVEVDTNDPDGYTLEVVVAEVDAPAGTGIAIGDLLLFGAPANGATIATSSATDGFETALRPTDFTLRVDGDEAPGASRFEVRYRVYANP